MKKRKIFISIIFCLLINLSMFINAEAASSVKLNKTNITIQVGKTYKLKVKGTKKKVKWKTKNKKVATVNSKGKVTGKKAGKTTITAKVGKKTLKCKVTVKGLPEKPKPQKPEIPQKPEVIIPNPWDNVEVIIPETVGSQRVPSNRMKITKYSFYNATYSSASYYYMNYQYKLVKYGKTSWSNWGEYFYCYDKNGNILDKCYMYASSLALNRTYIDDAMIPLGTAKIVFMEYPDTVNEPEINEPETNEPETNKPETNESETNKPETNEPETNEPETNEPEEPAPKKTGKTILKEYIMRYGSTNSDGEKLIRITNVKDGAVLTFGIIYKNSTDSFRFMMTYERSDCGSVMSIDVPNTDVTLLTSEFIFVYLHQSGGFSAKGMIDMKTYNENTDIDFKITESYGFNSETMKLLPTLADSNLKLSMSGWDVLLANKVGITMKDIGFLSYN